MYVQSLSTSQSLISGWKTWVLKQYNPQRLPGTRFHMGGERKMWLRVLPKDVSGRAEFQTFNPWIESQANEPLHHKHLHINLHLKFNGMDLSHIELPSTIIEQE